MFKVPKLMTSTPAATTSVSPGKMPVGLEDESPIRVLDNEVLNLIAGGSDGGVHTSCGMYCTAEGDYGVACYSY